MGHLVVCHRVCQAPPRVSPLLGAEAHLPEQLVRAPAAGEGGRGQLEGGPGREGVRSEVRAGQGEECLLCSCGPKGPSAVHAPGRQSRLPPRLHRVEHALNKKESFVLLPLGRHQRLGANKLDHPLRGPPQVDVETYRGVPRDCPSRQPFRRMEKRRQARVYQQAVNARGSCSLRAVVRAEDVLPQGGRQLQVRIRQPASKEGRQDRRRHPNWVVQVKVQVPPHQLRGRPVSHHVLCGVVLESTVEGWLGRNAVRHPGMQSIRPPAQANQDVAPAVGMPEGQGEGVRLGAGCPLGGEDLFGWDALPPLLAHATCPPPPWDSTGAP